MIALNLLSPSQKAALRSRVFFALIERLMIVLTGIALLGSVLLLLIRIELTRNLSDVQARQVLTKDYARANSDIGVLNQQLGRIDALQRMAFSPSALLRDLASRTPDGVAVGTLDVDMKSGSMRLNGTSARREELLTFEAAMKQSPFVKSLESPISNLFQRRDISFHFDIILNPAALRAPFEPSP